MAVLAGDAAAAERKGDGIGNILSQLRAEHAAVTEIIMSLERLAVTGTKRRGRPSKWLTNAKARGTAPRTPGRQQEQGKHGVSWEYTKDETRYGSCDRTGVRIMGSNDWGQTPVHWEGFSELAPSSHKVGRKRSGPDDMDAYCQCGKGEIVIEQYPRSILNLRFRKSLHLQGFEAAPKRDIVGREPEGFGAVVTKSVSGHQI